MRHVYLHAAAFCRSQRDIRQFDRYPIPVSHGCDRQQVWPETTRGITMPWTLAASVALGIGLMFTRPLLGTEGALADSDRLMGALTMIVAILAAAEVVRALWFLNVLFGAGLLAAPFLLKGAARRQPSSASWLDWR